MAAGRDRQGGEVVATLRQLPPDLAFVLAVLGLTIASIFTPVIRETPIRVLFGLPLMLFIPGYVFIAALFPEAGSHTAEDRATDGAADADETLTNRADGTVSETVAAITASESGIDGIERVALSFGTSIAIVPLIGLVLNFTPWGIRLIPIVVSLSGFTVVTTFIAAERRLALPSEVRFTVPYRTWIASAREELLEPDSRGDAALNVLLVCSLLLATGSVGYAVAVPKHGESFSEFYVLTETDDGDLVADGYPEEFVAGENRTLTVGIGNHEYEPVSYSVVVFIQDVEIANNTTTVLSQQQLNRFQTTLDHNETWHHQHAVAPTLTGENLRLTYLLYRGTPPAAPTTENAYRELHLWVNVTAATE